MKSALLAYLFITTAVFCHKGFGPGEQEWGYVQVRDGARMFWWLYQTTADVDNYTQRPLVIWLQGGPGSSSTGIGNFQEFGPLDVDLNPRNYSWVNEYNVLFVDNPVGTGFSHVDEYFALATSNKQIADDFLIFLQEFYKTIPELKNIPLYIFSESYGGKMTIQIALAIDQAVKNGSLDVNLVGVGLGDSWISSADSCINWGTYLFNLGIIDENAYESIEKLANTTKTYVENENWSEAMGSLNSLQSAVIYLTSNINFYNVLDKIHVLNIRAVPEPLKTPTRGGDPKLYPIMYQVRAALGLDTDWNNQESNVFEYLSLDYMKPVTDIVEQVLNTTNIKVAVFNGNLDLMVPTPGVIDWVDRLKFEGSESWKNTAMDPIIIDHVIEGYYKKVGNLAFYSVDRAGHMVPLDNPAAMRFILQDISS